MSLVELIRGKSARDTYATATLATVATQAGGNGRTVASVATVAVATPHKSIPEPIPGPPAIVGAGDLASRWWLIHFPDREPLELACFPPATHAEILEHHPVAIAAEPFTPATPEPARACSTCSHICRSGCCGNPVAAGLSDLEGVIRYHPHQGEGCPAWLATLDRELERRILAMAERCGCSGDELAQALDAARKEPDGWRRVLEAYENEGSR